MAKLDLMSADLDHQNTDTLLKLQNHDPTLGGVRSKAKPDEEMANEQVCFLQDKGLMNFEDDP